MLTLFDGLEVGEGNPPIPENATCLHVEESANGRLPVQPLLIATMNAYPATHIEVKWAEPVDAGPGSVDQR